MGWGELHRPRGAEAMLGTPAPGTLGARERAANVEVPGLGRIDVDHLLAEHRAATAELHRLRDALHGLARALTHEPCFANPDGHPCECCVTTVDLVTVWTSGVIDLREVAS